MKCKFIHHIGTTKHEIQNSKHQGFFYINITIREKK